MTSDGTVGIVPLCLSTTQSNKTPTTPSAWSSAPEWSTWAGRRSNCRSGTPLARSAFGNGLWYLQTHVLDRNRCGAWRLRGALNPAFPPQVGHAQLLQRSRWSAPGLRHHQVGRLVSTLAPPSSSLALNGAINKSQPWLKGCHLLPVPERNLYSLPMPSCYHGYQSPICNRNFHCF